MAGLNLTESPRPPMESSSPPSKPHGTLGSLPSVSSAPSSTRRITSGTSRESGREAGRDNLKDGTFYSTLNIDMKKQGSVGNVRISYPSGASPEYESYLQMSVSPSSKDLVMASYVKFSIISCFRLLSDPFLGRRKGVRLVSEGPSPPLTLPLSCSLSTWIIL